MLVIGFKIVLLGLVFKMEASLLLEIRNFRLLVLVKICNILQNISIVVVDDDIVHSGLLFLHVTLRLLGGYLRRRIIWIWLDDVEKIWSNPCPDQGTIHYVFFWSGLVRYEALLKLVCHLMHVWRFWILTWIDACFTWRWMLAGSLWLHAWRCLVVELNILRSSINLFELAYNIAPLSLRLHRRRSTINRVRVDFRGS